MRHVFQKNIHPAFELATVPDVKVETTVIPKMQSTRLRWQRESRRLNLPRRNRTRRDFTSLQAPSHPTFRPCYCRYCPYCPRGPRPSVLAFGNLVLAVLKLSRRVRADLQVS